MSRRTTKEFHSLIENNFIETKRNTRTPRGTSAEQIIENIEVKQIVKISNAESASIRARLRTTVRLNYLCWGFAAHRAHVAEVFP